MILKIFSIGLLCLMAGQAAAGDTYRPGGLSRHGVPTADPFDPTLRVWAETNEGIKNGDTFRRDLAGTSMSVSVIGCYQEATQTESGNKGDNSDSPRTNGNTCSNSGNLTGSLSGSFKGK